MKKTRRPPEKPAPNLSDEDQAIWLGTAETLKPLRGAKGRVRQPAATSDPIVEKAPPRAAAAKSRRQAENDLSKQQVRPAPAEARPNAPPPLAHYDKRKERRLARGQSDVDARIDLHGLRQSEAHSALNRFLHDCFARGLRHVLVITGKGDPTRPRDQGDWSMGEAPSGVLRRNVPRWLSEPDLRAIVVSYTPAAKRHGGEGALYVHLRNPERAR